MDEYIEREITCFDDCFYNPICIFRIKGDEWKKCIHFKNKADVVGVVRCKNCIHYYELEPVCLKIYSDGNVSADAWQERKPNDFCSYGEVKTDEKGEG